MHPRGVSRLGSGSGAGVGKEVSAEDKAERNRIRARIRYALESVGMLEEKARSPQQGKGGKGKASKSKGEAAADAVAGATEVATTNPANRFSAVCSILRAMDRNELLRVANEVASLIAAATSNKAETAEPAVAKPARKRKAKAA